MNEKEALHNLKMSLDHAIQRGCFNLAQASVVIKSLDIIEEKLFPKEEEPEKK